MNLARLVERNAKTYGDRPALSLGDRLVETHASLALRCQAVAAHLRLNLRLTPGDKVALAMANVPDIWPALFGIWWAGLTAVPMNEKLHAKEFDWILKDSGARACFASPGLAEPIASVFDAGQVIAEAGFPEADFPVVPTSPETRAWLFYTSGTTGRPKGAILSHRNLMMMILSYFCDIDRVGPGDCILHAAPATHGSGMWGLAHTAGAAENVFPESAGFDPQEIVALSKSRQGLSMFAAPTMITRLVAHPSIEGIDLASLKTITYGGAPMYLSDLTRAMEVFPGKLAQIYGQGEAPMTITGLGRELHGDHTHPRFLERLASVGTARTGVEVDVVDGDGQPVALGEAGEVVVRGDVVMTGYLNQPEASASALRDGWLHTGDIGSMSPDGFVTLKDRSKDLIISGGSNVYPREVEEVLLSHPGLAEVSVVGAPDADWGEVVVAFVVARPGAKVTDGELDRLCIENIGRFKRPRHWLFVEALPKNEYGKVLKTELREIARRNHGVRRTRA